MKRGHRWLQRIAEDEAKGWTRARVERSAAIANELPRAASSKRHRGRDGTRVDALALSLDDERGRWLLGPQPNARNEYRISAMIDGVRHDLVIDRMFEDLTGRGSSTTRRAATRARSRALPRGEEERYRAQLERYAAATGKADARRGLYFPLLKGWREWN